MFQHEMFNMRRVHDMVKLSNVVLEKLASQFSLKPEELQYLAGGREDSDGIVYVYEKSGRKFVMKIIAMKKGNGLERVTKKLEFARFLGEHGVWTAFPRADERGNIFYIEEDEQYQYLASTMDYIEGTSPKTEELEDKLIYNWGKLTGKMHRITKDYPIWKNINELDHQYGYEQEIDSFYQMCRNDIVKEKWLEIKEELSKLEITRDTYGMIHNDNHQYNLIADKNGLTLIDFDCANCHFFIQDILLPAQGLLFDKAGGMNRPIVNQDAIQRFYDQFLNGYEKENHISNQWLDRMESFLNYRRLLLFTVMQGWMEQDESARNSFLELIQNPVKLQIIS